MSIPRPLAAAALLVLAACPIDSGPGDVSGVVVDLESRPLPGVEVRIGATSTRTDASGAFTLPRPDDGPYDAAVLRAGGVVVYRGLTGAAPFLTVPVSSGPSTSDPPARRASITGALAGGPELGGALSAGATQVVFRSPEVASAAGGADAGGSAYAIDPVAWTGGPAETSGFVEAVQGASPGGWPMTSFAYASRGPVTVRDGVALSAADLALAPVGARLLSTSGRAATGDALAVNVWMRTEHGALLLVNWLPDASGGATIPVPALTGVTYRLEASAAGGSGSGSRVVRGVPLDGTVDLSIPAPPVLLAPADGAVDVGGATTFRWSAPPGGVSHLSISTACRRVDVIGVGTEVSLADLGWAGVDLPGGAPGQWSVRGYVTSADVDAVAVPEGLPRTFAGLSTGTPTTTTVTWSPERTFTTASGPPACDGGVGVPAP